MAVQVDSACFGKMFEQNISLRKYRHKKISSLNESVFAGDYIKTCEISQMMVVHENFEEASSMRKRFPKARLDRRVLLNILVYK
jgi:hypothetical protein